MPQVSIRRIEDLEDDDPEKQLHISRQKRAEEFKKVEKDLNRLKRNQTNKGWL
jgi:hypothetical protein